MPGMGILTSRRSPESFFCTVSHSISDPSAARVRDVTRRRRTSLGRTVSGDLEPGRVRSCGRLGTGLQAVNRRRAKRRRRPPSPRLAWGRTTTILRPSLRAIGPESIPRGWSVAQYFPRVRRKKTFEVARKRANPFAPDLQRGAIVPVDRLAEAITAAVPRSELEITGTSGRDPTLTPKD